MTHPTVIELAELWLNTLREKMNALRYRKKTGEHMSETERLTAGITPTF